MKKESFTFVPFSQDSPSLDTDAEKRETQNQYSKVFSQLFKFALDNMRTFNVRSFYPITRSSDIPFAVVGSLFTAFAKQALLEKKIKEIPSLDTEDGPLYEVI